MFFEALMAAKRAKFETNSVNMVSIEIYSQMREFRGGWGSD